MYGLRPLPRSHDHRSCNQDMRSLIFGQDIWTYPNLSFGKAGAERSANGCRLTNLLSKIPFYKSNWHHSQTPMMFVISRSIFFAKEDCVLLVGRLALVFSCWIDAFSNFVFVTYKLTCFSITLCFATPSRPTFQKVQKITMRRQSFVNVAKPFSKMFETWDGAFVVF